MVWIWSLGRIMTDIRLDIKGKRPSFFGDPAIDTMMTALLETMSENYALRERLHALEAALENKGVISSDDVETAKISEETLTKMQKDQQDFLTDAFRALNANFHSRAAHQALVE